MRGIGKTGPVLSLAIIWRFYFVHQLMYIAYEA